MKIIIYKNREVYKENSKIGNDSENKVETLDFEFPEEFKDFNKYIEFQIKGEKCVDLIRNNQYVITRSIAKYGKIKTQIVLKKIIDNDTVVFKSNIFTVNVSASINASEEIEQTLHAGDYITRLENVETKNAEQDTNIQKNTEDMNEIKKVVNLNDEKIQENAENIEQLKSKNTELKAENERLREDLNNIVPSISGEGESVTLKGTANARFKKFGISGNSWQETGDVTDEEGNVIGTMPSPGYKSDIQNVTGNANFHIVPELADISKFTTNGYVNSLGTHSSPTGRGEKATEPVKVKPNTNYTFFIINTNSKFDNWIGIGEYEEESSSSFIKRNTSTASFKYNFTTSEKTNYVILSARNLEEATNVSFYETSKIQSFTFPLAEGQRLMKGDYLADDEIHHKRGQIELDGTEEIELWTTTQSGYKRFAIKKTGIKYSENGLCSHFAYYKNQTGQTQEGTSICIVDNYITIKVDEAIASTVNELKTYLASQKSVDTPVILEYDLSQEDIETYTTEQQTVHNEIKKTAKSYGDTTHIFSTDEISPIFDVEALRDLNVLFTEVTS